MKRFILLLLLFASGFALQAQTPAPGSLDLTRVGLNDVRLTWGQPAIQKSSSDTLKWDFVNTFLPTSFGHALYYPASDGKHIYVASWSGNEDGSTNPSVIYKYTMDGKYLENFRIEGLKGSLRDLAYDGEYFYATISGVSGLYQIDFLNERKVVSVIPLNYDSRAVAYVPTLDNGKGGFLVSDDNGREGKLIKRNGEVIPDITFKMHFPWQSASYHDGKIYAFGSTGMNGTYGNEKFIEEYDVTTGTTTYRQMDVSYALKDLIEMDRSYLAGGIEMFEYPQGHFRCVFGLQFGGQFTPERIVVMEMNRGELPADLQGYNVYKNDRKLNTEVIDKMAYTFVHTGAVEGEENTYSVKAQYTGGESEAVTASIFLPDSKVLPMFEDFESQSFEDGFWNIPYQDSTAWTFRRFNLTGSDQIITTADFKGAVADTGHQDDYLETRLLTAKGKESVLFRYQVSVSVRHAKVTDTFMVDAWDGTTWTSIDSIVPKYIYNTPQTPLEQREFDLSHLLADKEQIKIRFRVKGLPFGPTSNKSYDYFINEVKIWAPEYTQAEGTLTHKGTPVPNAKVTFNMENDIISYTATTDENGHYLLEEMETGTYSVLLKHDQYNSLEVPHVAIQAGNNTQDYVLTQPEMTISEKNITLSLAPDKVMHYQLPLSNVGDGETDWIAEFEFPKTKAAEESQYSWDVFTSWTAQGNVEVSYMYYNGIIYSPCTTNNKYIAKYSKFGKLLGFDTIPTGFPTIKSLFTDGENAYILSSNWQASYIIRYNPETYKIYDSLSCAKNMAFAACNPLNGGFFIGSGYNILSIEKNGDTAAIYNFTSAGIGSIAGIAFDNVTSDFPALWIFTSKGVTGEAIQGENMGIYQYNLETRTVTGVAHTPNDIPGYTAPIYSQRQSVQPAGLSGSMELFPGKFMLIGGLKYSGNPLPNLCFIYDMGQSVKWISMKEYHGNTQPGDPIDFELIFNTNGTQHGDVLNANVVFSFDPAIDPFVVPVQVNIDTTVDENCFVPSRLEMTAHLDHYVDLSYDIRNKNGEIVDESHLLGFNIMRNGIKINEKLHESKTYRDSTPVIGWNRYQVQAVYDFNCESFWSAPDSIDVKFNGTCNTVSSVSTEVINQRHLEITWNVPVNETSGIVDGFEEYEAFSVENIGEWTTIDRDRSKTYAFTRAQFPHQGEPMSFIVFNPYECKPEAQALPYQGKQFLGCFSASVTGVENDDWLISPEIPSGKNQILTFMAKSHSSTYGLERINVGYSTTGNAPEDFQFFNGDKAILVPESWTSYTYQLPQDVKYIAIQCVSLNSFLLLIDDIFIGAPREHLVIDKYQVWRNGTEMTTLEKSAVGLYDFALVDGTYSYEIAVNYTNGCVSEKSQPVSVTIDYTNKPQAVTNLHGEYMPESNAASIEWTVPAWSDPEIFKYHTGEMTYGFGMRDNQGNPATFYVGAAVVGSELQSYMDYSFSGLQIGLMDSAEVTAFVLDVQSGQFLTEQKMVRNPLNPWNSFHTVMFDQPVKIDVNKTYIFGYKVANFDAANEKWPVASDNGPLAENHGNFISMNGMSWTTTTEQYGEDYAQNWSISAILEVIGTVEGQQSPVLLGSTESKAFGSASHTAAAEIKTSTLLEIPAGDQIQSIDPITGFMVYRDGTALTSTPITDQEFLDTELKSGANNYWIGTLYKNAGEKLSDTLTIYSTLNNEETEESEIRVSMKERKIRVSLNPSSSYSVQVYNLSGNRIRHYEGLKNDVFFIDMDKESAGIYMVRIIMNDQAHVAKVILH